MRRKTPEHLPSRPIGWRPVLWCAGALFVLGGLAAGLWLATAELDVARAERFAGTLRPQAQAAVVRLPAHVPLLSVLVEPGEQVRKGQTIALLDQAAIESLLEQIEREIRAAAVLRECLISGGGPTDMALQQSGFDSETQLLARAARDECQALRARHAPQLARIEEAEALLSKRLSLTQRRISLVLSAEDAPVLQARAALQLALDRNQILDRLSQLKLQAGSLRSASDTDRIARQRQAAEQVAALRHRKAILARYLDAPRLTAPQAGKVARVRPLLVGTGYADTEDLLELRDHKTGAYDAEFFASLPEAKQLREGMQVSFTLLGYPENGPVLGGRIGALHADQDQRLRVSVVLDAQSGQRLADPAGGVALRGNSTASQIWVSLDSAPLRDTAARLLQQILSAPVSAQRILQLRDQRPTPPETPTDL